MTVFVRPVRKTDAEQFASWHVKSPSFDPNTVAFPTSYTLCAFKQRRVLAYMPVQEVPFLTTQVLDSIVKNPDATDLELAEAMRELVKHCITIGYIKKTEDIYFIGDHPETNALASRIFEKVEYPVYRLNLRDLE